MLIKNSFKEYREMEGINCSLLKDFISDPKLFYLTEISKVIPPEPEERHFIVGRAIHSMILEPDNFDNDFMVGEYRQNTKEGKANKIQAEKEFKSLISEEEKQLAIYFANELPKQHEWIRDIVMAINVYSEITITININGIILKIRADRVIEYNDFIDFYDIKSSSKKDNSGFISAIADYDYLLQYAFYRFVLEQHFNKPVRFGRFVFCSKEYPRNIGFIAVDNPEYYDVGFAVIKKGLSKYYEAQTTGIWYQEQINNQSLILKPYQLQKYYDYLERN